MSRSGGLLAIAEPCSRTERGSQEGLLTSPRGLRYTGTPCSTSPSSRGGRDVHAFPVPTEGVPVPVPDRHGDHRPPRPPRYIAGAPVPLSPGVDAVTADRDPPVRLPYASLAPLPYGAPPPSRVPPGAPQRLRHRRRRQDSLLYGAPAGKPRAHVHFSGPSPGTARAPSGMLPEHSPGTRDGTRHCTPCSSTSPASPGVPFDAPRRALPGVRRSYLSKKFSHPLRDGPFSPGTTLQIRRTDGFSFLPRPCPLRPPRLEPSPGTRNVLG